MVKINIYILIFFDSEQTWTGADMPSPDIMWVSTLATPHLASIAQQRPALALALGEEGKEESPVEL